MLPSHSIATTSIIDAEYGLCLSLADYGDYTKALRVARRSPTPTSSCPMTCIASRISSAAKVFVNAAAASLAGFVAVLVLTNSASATNPALELKKGDHIAIVGNGLAERMQHDGWLETY